MQIFHWIFINTHYILIPNIFNIWRQLLKYLLFHTHEIIQILYRKHNTCTLHFLLARSRSSSLEHVAALQLISSETLTLQYEYKQ